MNLLKELQDWYLSQCDEDWEHTFGIKLETLDNPGWLLKIDLAETSLYEKPFTKLSYGVTDQLGYSGNDWIECKVEGGIFIGAGGPLKLEEIITIFLQWAKV